MGALFVSYRRDDSRPWAERLCDRLAQTFGTSNVFIDTGSISPGVNFVEVIRESIAAADVMLLLVGANWGPEQLFDPNDFVKLELLEALTQETPIVPVLIGSAVMPHRDEFPDELSDIANLHAAKLRGDPDFKIDVERIIGGVTGLLPTGVPPGRSRPRDVSNTIPVGDKPRPPVAAGDSVWVPNSGSANVSRIEVETGQVIDTISVGEGPQTPLVTPDALWVANEGSGTLSRISTETGEVSHEIAVGRNPTTPVFAGGCIWVPNAGSGTITRIDARRVVVLGTISVGKQPHGPAVSDGCLWVSSWGSNTVTRIDAQTAEVTDTIAVPGPKTPAIADGSLWVPSRRWASVGAVSRISVANCQITDTIEVSGGNPWPPLVADGSVWVPAWRITDVLPGRSTGPLTRIDIRSGDSQEIVVGADPLTPVLAGDSIWVPNWGSGTVSRVDPVSGRMRHTQQVGKYPSTPAVAGDSIWVPNWGSGTVTRIRIG